MNGAMPIHCAPSPPICVMPVISPLPSGFSSTIVWQPMPAPTSVPSGACTRAVVRAAGAEERGARRHRQLGRAAVRSRRASASARLDRVDRARRAPRSRAATARAIRSASRSSSRGQQRLAALVALAEDARRAGHAVERLLEVRLEERALLLDDEDLVEPVRELAHDLAARAARASPASGSGCRRARGRAVEAEPAQRVHQVVVGLAGADDAEPGARRRPRSGSRRSRARRRARGRCAAPSSVAPCRATPARAGCRSARARTASVPLDRRASPA